MILMSLAFIMLGASSCGGGNGSGGDGNGDISNISVALRSPNVGNTQSSQFITVTATGSWTISVNQTWAKVNPASGNGNKSDVILSYDANSEQTSRTAIITIKSGTKTATAVLTQAGTGTQPDPGTDPEPSDKTNTAANGWLELPGQTIESNHKFASHDMTQGAKQLRSFSLYYSMSDLVALWVAYPLNRGLIGSGSRTDNWGADPKFTNSEQAILYSAYRGGYDRGHQLPSADRYNRADNIKTFYFTNMTPQVNAFNGQIWANLEGKVRGWASSCDTLYVVTGCVVKGSTKKAYDNNGKAVTVPVAYYKAVLRYSNGSTLGHNGYMGLGVYLEHRSYSEGSVTATSPSGAVMSIDALEAKLGIDLFANLPKKVGESVAAQIEAQDPKNVSYWW